MNNPRIIIPLDYAEGKDALDMARMLEPGRCRLKIGKELFTRCGPQLVEQIVDMGFPVFLDLKFHDIPNTVAGACRAAAVLGVWMVNVHISGGKNMLLAAREALDNAQHVPLLTGVTVLTSLGEQDLQQLGINKSIADTVLDMALLARECKLDGVVCSAQEVSMLRTHLAKPFLLVTPGIRPAGADKNDQNRIMTPAEAIRQGSDYLVIGRPITQAPDPMQALDSIEQEIASINGDR